MNSAPRSWQERVPAHRAPRSQQHVPEPRELRLQSRALAVGRDKASVGRLPAAVSLWQDPPQGAGSAPRLLLSTGALAHGTGVLREQLGVPSHRKGCPRQSPAEARQGPAQAQCSPRRWESQVYSRGLGKHNFNISREGRSHPTLPAGTARGTEALPLRDAALPSRCCTHMAEDCWWADGAQPLTSWAQTLPEGVAWLHCTFPPSCPARDGRWNQSPELPPFPSPARGCAHVLLYAFLRVVVLFC